MKKFLLAALAGVLLMGYASTAMAEITVGGDIEIRYALWNDLTLNHQLLANDTQNFFDQRVRLHVDAQVAEGLSAYVELDSLNYDWGLPTTATLIPFYLNFPRNPLFIHEAWVNFMIPGMPVGVKIGHQPLALGHGIWLDTHRDGSDAILVYSMPIPELLIAGAYVQMGQGISSFPGTGNISSFNRIGGGLGTNGYLLTGTTSALKDDPDAYALLANYTWMEGNTVGVNFTYVDDDTSLDALVHTHIRAYNTMLNVDGAIGPVNYKGEFDWLYINSADLFGSEQDYIVSAWAAMLGAGTNVQGILDVNLEVAYGTGNDGTSDSPNLFYNPGGVGVGGANRHDNAYYTPYNSTSYNYAYLYNDKIGQGPYGIGGGFGFSDGYGGFGLANTGYVKLSVGVTPIEKLNAGMDVIVLRASEQLVKGQQQYLGTEIDAHASYDIYDNLSLKVQGGYFIAGGWYKFGNQVNGPALGNPDTAEDPTDATTSLQVDNAWGAEATLNMSF